MKEFDLTYEQFIGNSKEIKAWVNQDIFEQFIEKSKSILSEYEVLSYTAKPDLSSGTVVLSFLISTTYEKAASIGWIFTEYLIKKDLNKEALIINFLGNQNPF